MLIFMVLFININIYYHTFNKLFTIRDVYSLKQQGLVITYILCSYIYVGYRGIQS